jgi:hypothetical protein
MAKRVGVVSSIALPQGAGTLWEALTGPLTAAGHTVLPLQHANGNYDANSKRDMKRAVRRLLNVPNRPDLVIAVGGLVAARAVSDYTEAVGDLPFLVCIGRAPNEGSSLWDNDQFMGGINLDSANQNAHRAALLKQRYPGVTSVRDICLYYNKQSHMAAREAREWSFLGKLMESTVDHTAANTAAQFRNDFRSLPVGTKAVIVSSDPFFASKANEITAAALAEFPGRPICYPNAVYHASAQPGFRMVYGANLKQAYAALGNMAVAFLALPQPANMGLDTPIPETIDGPPSPAPVIFDQRKP